MSQEIKIECITMYSVSVEIRMCVISKYVGLVASALFTKLRPRFGIVTNSIFTNALDPATRQLLNCAIYNKDIFSYVRV